MRKTDKKDDLTLHMTDAKKLMIISKMSGKQWITYRTAIVSKQIQKLYCLWMKLKKP